MASIEDFTKPKKRKTEVIYKQIHILYRKPNSQCEFFEYREEGGNYIARCLVLGRYLTRDEVVKCENYWKTCPYRKIGKKMAETLTP